MSILDTDTIDFAYQEEVVQEIDHFGGRALVALEQGLGKAQPTDARILTPDGWVPIGFLEVGDLVIGSQGNPIKVLGVFPQGTKQIYSVLMQDGSQTECCLDHLWTMRKQRRRLVTLPLEQIRKDTLKTKTNWKYYSLMLRSPVIFSKNDLLPIDPYLMGYLIGNGCLRTHAGVSIPDLETVERVRELLPSGCILKKTSQTLKIDYIVTGSGDCKNPLLRSLRLLEFVGKYSHEKRIPEIYLRSSVDDRIALLQGLMDSDGSVSFNHLEFSSSSPGLVADVQDLVECLGGCGKISLRKSPKYTHKGEIRFGRDHSRLAIKLPESIKPFRLSRKAKNYNPSKWSAPTRPLVSITEAGKKECVCISVDAEDGLYVTDHAILTHNTKCSLEWTARNDAYPALVICPAAVKFNWERESVRFIGCRPSICEGRKPPRNGYGDFDMKSKITIINYDILKGWLPYLIDHGFSTLIIDEVQNLGNPSSLRTRCCKKLGHFATNILALSGTPLLNRPYELYSILSILWPEHYNSPWVYSQKFCEPQLKPWGWDHTGAKNLNILHAELKQYGMIRRLKKDVLKDLPDKVWRVVPCELMNHHQYQEAFDDFLSFLKKNAPHKVHAASKAEKLVQIGFLMATIERLKLKATVNWANDFLENSDEKLVLFAHHKKAIEVLKKRIEYPNVVVDGSVTGRQRQWNVDQFQDNPKVRILIGSEAAGVGINLTAASEVGISALPWRPGDICQWVDRCHRIGQKDTVFCNFLIAENTIEEDKLRLLQKKQHTITSVLDGEIAADDSASVYEELLRGLEHNL